MKAMHRGLATLFKPEDIYIANLMGALNQINNGATTLVDWCHNNPTPDHTDVAACGWAARHRPQGFGRGLSAKGQPIGWPCAATVAPA
jgi:hypothetical protein